MSQVAPSRVSETLLYALTCPPAGIAAHVLETTDGGAAWATTTDILPADVAGCDGASFSLQTSVTDADVAWIDGFNTGVHSGNTLNLTTDAKDVSPPAETTDDRGFAIHAIADNPRGGFIVATTYGLVQLQ